jgi:cytosine/adenosine deaminase-related metal-dependent hydrolase
MLRYRLESAAGIAIGVEGGRIGSPEGSFDLSIDLGPGELRPGLINAHDHLHRNHYPRLGSPPYPDAYAWGTDIHERCAADIARGRALDRHDALLFGALKNLLGGATTVVHHDVWEPDFNDSFPVRVARVRVLHSLRFEPRPGASSGRDEALPLCIHLAEGTTAEAADEVRELERLGLLARNLLAVHAVGVDPDGVHRLKAAGAAIVWCPTSNLFLLGRTAPRELLDSGVAVLIGSDSLLTGDGTLLDELRSAARLGMLGPERLLDGVGATAAARLGLPAPTLAEGATADIVHLRRPALDAAPADVALVIVRGVPRLGDVAFTALFERSGVQVERLRVGGTEKVVAAPLATVAERVVAAWPESGRILRSRRSGSASAVRAGPPVHQ